MNGVWLNAGMLLASQATRDSRFRDYAEKRLQFIAESVLYFRSTTEAHADWQDLLARSEVF